jgi:uncharacterized iron-regulated membrane protein
MKRFRKFIFWCHLAAGLFAGIVVLIMSVTGVLLTYEKQMIAQADRRTYSIVPPSPAARLPIETLVLRAREAKPGSSPTAITFRSDQSAAATIAFGREGNVLINPYTGETLGEGAQNVRGFFRFVTDLHRWLGAGGESRAVGRAITGASNLAFLFLVVSGLYLWFPGKWTLTQFRNVAWFKRGLSGRARDFNWHNTIGFWCLIPLFIIVLSAVTISYTWASNLVYQIVGETPPAQQQQPGAQSSARNEANLSISYDNLDSLLARAEQHSNDWRTISVQLPTTPDAPVNFIVDASGGGQPQKRAQIVFNRATGKLIRTESYADLSRGRRLRSWLRFAHTGEFYGFIGQTIAGLASLGGAFLVWTGLSLAWRRFRAWRRRRGRGNTNRGAELIDRAPDLESAVK